MPPEVLNFFKVFISTAALTYNNEEIKTAEKSESNIKLFIVNSNIFSVVLMFKLNA